MQTAKFNVKRFLLALVCCIWFAQCGSTAAEAAADATILELRHNAPPPAKSAAVQAMVGSPPDTTKKGTSKLLDASPCQPEKDGYFGGTWGEPAEIQYALALELSSQIHPDDLLNRTQSVLAEVRAHVMEATMAAAFPALCRRTGRRGRQLSSSNPIEQGFGGTVGHSMPGVTGFQFGPIDTLLRTYLVW